MLVINRDESETVPDRLGAVLLAALAIHPKSVWLCASQADAAAWRQAVGAWLTDNNLVHPTWTLTSLGNEIDEFKAAPQGHLFVAGRFDGMDFKADECRLVILATLPRAINLQEEFFTAYLRDAGFMLRRLNQRIVQALGRCNRAEDDFALYLLADPRFAVHFGRGSQREGLPRNILAEVDSAEDAAELATPALIARVTAFLGGDFRTFDDELAAVQANLPGSIPVHAGVENSTDEVLGWLEVFKRLNYRRGAEHFASSCYSAAAGASELPAFLRWCEAKALYLAGEQGDAAARDQAPRTLESAIGQGRTSSWFNRQRAALNRYRHEDVGAAFASDSYKGVLLERWDERLERLGTRDSKFERWCNRLREQLESASHNEYCAGMEELGDVLGFTASRPRHTAATDCRWRAVIGNARELIVFEAKIEHEPGGKITPSAVGQAHNQLERAHGEFDGRGYAFRGVILTHLTDIDDSASASLGALRIVPKNAVRALAERALSLLAEYRGAWSVDNLEARRVSAGRIESQIPTAGWLTRALSSDTEFMSRFWHHILTVPAAIGYRWLASAFARHDRAPLPVVIRHPAVRPTAAAQPSRSRRSGWAGCGSGF
jgi:hypothetical protein